MAGARSLQQRRDRRARFRSRLLRAVALHPRRADRPPGGTSRRTARSWSTGRSRAGPSARSAAISRCSGPIQWGAPWSGSASPGRRAWSIVAPARAVLLLPVPARLSSLFITNTAPASRYLNPVLPFLAIARGLDDSATGRQVSRAPRAAVWLVGRPPVAVSPLIHSIRTDAFFRTDDTRALAQRFIEARIPAGARS